MQCRNFFIIFCRHPQNVTLSIDSLWKSTTFCSLPIPWKNNKISPDPKQFSKETKKNITKSNRTLIKHTEYDKFFCFLRNPTNMPNSHRFSLKKLTEYIANSSWFAIGSNKILAILTILYKIQTYWKSRRLYRNQHSISSSHRLIIATHRIPVSPFFVKRRILQIPADLP